MNMVYPTMDELFYKSVEAVTAFGTIYEHLEVVEEVAPRGIHVMVEAIGREYGTCERMEELAKKHNIHLLTNYETTWYPSTQRQKHLYKRMPLVACARLWCRTGIKARKRLS